jgi:hypothetical protein
MCTARPLLIALLVVILGASSGVVAAQDPRSGPELLTAAERSFSTFAFGTREGLSGLSIVIREDCEVRGECSYQDANRVDHFFWEGELVVKSVEAGDQWIAALGIGRARSLDEVLEQVRLFLPEATIDCSHDAEGTQNCGAMLGDGWISLTFDTSGRLTLARIDAYHFT